MPTRLVLTQDDGTRIAEPPPIGGFSYSIIQHDVGVLQVCIGQEWASRIDYECRIECWRDLSPSSSVLVRSYFIEIIEEATDAQRRNALYLTCLDANALLRWRDIYAFADSPQATKTDCADNVMRAYVRENLAGGASPLDSDYFSVEADQNAGPTLTVSNAWANLLQTLQSISDESDGANSGAGPRVYFQVADVQPSANYQFKCSTVCLGTDRSAGSGQQLSIGLDFGNVTSLVRTRDASNEVNDVVATGAGQGASMQTGEYVGSGATRSLWSGKKANYSDTALATTALLNSAAAKRVSAGKPLDRIVATLVDAPGFRFGFDWGFGDKLTVVHRNAAYTGLVKAVAWNVDDHGHETVDAKLEVLQV
jgi:Siphovirus ReqiPepy6 Gp37-like protein